MELLSHFQGQQQAALTGQTRLCEAGSSRCRCRAPRGREGRKAGEGTLSPRSPEGSPSPPARRSRRWSPSGPRVLPTVAPPSLSSSACLPAAGYPPRPAWPERASGQRAKRSRLRLGFPSAVPSPPRPLSRRASPSYHPSPPHCPSPSCDPSPSTIPHRPAAPHHLAAGPGLRVAPAAPLPG